MAKAETPKVEHPTATLPQSNAGSAANVDAPHCADLAAYHIQAAAALARQARRIELETAGRSFDKDRNPVYWNVSASVIMAWAALEANINHLIKSFEDENAGNVGQVERCSFLYREQVASKYEALARLKECDLRKAANIFGNLETLGEFRNALADFQPEWHDEGGKHAELREKMRELLEPIAGMSPDAMFPFCYLSYECAKWAVATAIEVSAHYAALVGAEDQLAASWIDVELP